MKTIEIKKMIQARAGLSNYSAISNIKWQLSRGIGATKWNAFDDIFTFDYKGGKYRLESKYPGAGSVIQDADEDAFEGVLDRAVEILKED